VEGVFDVADRPEIATLLDERGIDAEESFVVLKREVAAAGRARAWVNGSTVSASILAEVGRLLVNLHGQHEAQTLIEGDAQRRILDAFAGATEQASAVHDAYDTLASARRDITDLRRRLADAEKRADYLRHVVQEIEVAKLVDGEDARLEDEARRLENAEELRELSTGITTAIEGDDESVLERLGIIERMLSTIQRVDPTLARLQELYDNAYYNLEALARELTEYEASVELDPSRLDDVRRRRDLLYRLTKKYGPALTDVVEAGRAARAELDLVDSADLDLRTLEERERVAAAMLHERAAALSATRAQASDRLGRAVDGVLPDLGMPDGHFHAALVPLRDVGPDGAEAVEFRVSLNVGHEERPLARVASGGELSRVMLALKTILARLDRVPTLIFDEVDAGIGGRVGLQVGETMRRVATYHQVFAITHLPQIAARAHHHILVSKGARGGVTTADVAVLDGDDRITEIARMLGGDPESDVSRAHARELLESAATLGADVATAAAPARSTRRSKRG
jgi:DNA repair protein RecN (Recombination protein N)